MKSKIAVCITTRNRRAMFYATLAAIKRFTPNEFKIIIVDDASNLVVPEADFRFETNVGIARAKNKCLELASRWGAEHIFLFDDDTYPTAFNWWKPYVESLEHHLMYEFKLPGKPANDMTILFRDVYVIAYSHTRGAMIYVDDTVLDIVGGMDTDYGLYGFEHPDWTNRIHNAGLTTHRAMDVPDSDMFLHCLDEDRTFSGSSVTSDKRWDSLRRNAVLYRKNKASKEYKEFR